MTEKSTSFLKLRKYLLILERLRNPQKSFAASLFLYVITKFSSVMTTGQSVSSKISYEMFIAVYQTV
jgi:hypothetical protein